MKKNTAAKAELWTDRIRDFQDSGLSHNEWCQKQEIALSNVSAKYQGVPNTFAPTPVTDVRVVSILL